MLRKKHRPVVESLENRQLLSTVAYDFSKTAQTIDAIGGNYAKAPFYEEANDAIGQYTLDNLKPGAVRVPILLSQWEAANDNSDPNVKNDSAFAAADTGEVHDVFLMMQEYERRGLNITASVFNAPDWLVSNPTATDHRKIDASQWGEFAESIRAFLEYAKSNYGVTVDNVSVNEANGGYKLLFTAQQMTDFIKLAGPTMTGTGIGDPKWLVGDTYQVKNTAAYARTILSDAAAAPYLGPIAYHTWWSESVASSVWQEIANLGKEFNKPIWATEVGYDANAWTYSPSPFPTWSNAERLAVTYHKAIALAASNTLLYWQYQNDFPLMSADTTTKYPAYYVVKQLADNLTKGSLITSAASDTSTILALAAKNASNTTFVSQLINTSSTDKSMTLTGLPNAPITLVRTSNSGDRSKTIGTYTPTGGKLTLTFKGDSVNILTGNFAVAAAQTPYAGNPFAIGSGSTLIEAEAFDKGGEGIAYHDTDATNGGFAYRAGEGVDYQPVGTSGYRITNTNAGEWLEYTINVAAAGSYNLDYRISGKSTSGKFHFELRNPSTDAVVSNITGALSSVNTGNYDSLTTVRKTVTLPGGTNVLRLAFDTNSSVGLIASLDSFTISPVIVAPPTPPPAPTQTPYTSTFVIDKGKTTTIEAEAFDKGGEGIAYHDADTTNGGFAYRSSEGVDYQPVGASGYRITNTFAGEWVAYSINVLTAGSYNLALRASARATNGKYHFELRDPSTNAIVSNLTGTMSSVNTGNYDSLTTVNKAVSLPAGQYVLRLAIDASGSMGIASSFDWFAFW